MGTIMENLECIINSGLLSKLEKSEYIDCIEKLEITSRSYKRGEIIYFENSTINKICIVKTGSVRTEKNYTSGEAHILAVFEENSIFGLEIAMSGRKYSPVNFIANEACTILFISFESVEDTVYNSRLKRMLTEMLADQNIRMMHKIEILAERGLRSRLLVYFNILAQKAGSNRILIRMSREQLAQFLRVNRSALSNELSKMKQEGLIDFKKYDYILHMYTEDGKPIE